MRPLGWNSDSRDWERPGISAIVATVKKEVSNGPTVLFHDGGGDRSETVDALRQLLPWLKQQGYSFGFPYVEHGSFTYSLTTVVDRLPGSNRYPHGAAREAGHV